MSWSFGQDRKGPISCCRGLTKTSAVCEVYGEPGVWWAGGGADTRTMLGSRGPGVEELGSLCGAEASDRSSLKWAKTSLPSNIAPGAPGSHRMLVQDGSYFLEALPLVPEIPSIPLTPQRPSGNVHKPVP